MMNMNKTVLLLAALLASATVSAHATEEGRDGGMRDEIPAVGLAGGMVAEGDGSKSDSVNRDYTNLVLFVRFADDPEIVTPLSTFQSMFTDSAGGVAHFFETISYGQIHFNTVFAMQNSGNRIVSYVDSHPRGYFKPYSEENPMGTPWATLRPIR